MHIDIEQRKWSFCSKYDITSSSSSWSARKAFFSFNDRLVIYDESGSIAARIKSHFFIFRPKYTLVIGEEVYAFTCEKYWRGVYLCTNGALDYRLYHHKKRDYSIFLGGRQIAAFSKSMVSIGSGDTYHIRVDEDADLLVVICLALTVDTSTSEDKDTTITFDLGNFGPEDRPFDKAWKPNKRA